MASRQFVSDFSPVQTLERESNCFSNPDYIRILPGSRRNHHKEHLFSRWPHHTMPVTRWGRERTSMVSGPGKAQNHAYQGKPGQWSLCTLFLGRYEKWKPPGSRTKGVTSTMWLQDRAGRGISALGSSQAGPPQPRWASL